MKKYAAAAFFIVMTSPVAAYVGPGPGLTMLGSALGFLAAIAFALLVVIAYPIRLLILKLRGTHKKGGE